MPSLDELEQPSSYRQAIRALHAFHAVWEPAIWGTTGAAPVIAASGVSPRLPLLDRDMVHLDVTPASGALPAPALTTADALGALYVLQGASLGGRVISRRVAGPLSMDRDSGLAYFIGYGEDTGRVWKAFGAAMEQWSAEHDAADDIVAGATECFAALESWLRRHRTGSAADEGGA